MDTPPIVRPGYRLTMLSILATYELRQRFEDYRARRGRPPYFTDPAYGTDLTGSQPGFFLLDHEDLDEYEHAFLRGAAVRSAQGIRIPWHEEGHSAQLTSLEAAFLAAYFTDRGFLIWPSTHALVVVEHAYIRMLTTILSSSPPSEAGREQEPD